MGYILHGLRGSDVCSTTSLQFRQFGRRYVHRVCRTILALRAFEGQRPGQSELDTYSSVIPQLYKTEVERLVASWLSCILLHTLIPFVFHPRQPKTSSSKRGKKSHSIECPSPFPLFFIAPYLACRQLLLLFSGQAYVIPLGRQVEQLVDAQLARGLPVLGALRRWKSSRTPGTESRRV